MMASMLPIPSSSEKVTLVLVSFTSTMYAMMVTCLVSLPSILMSSSCESCGAFMTCLIDTGSIPFSALRQRVSLK